MSYGTDTWGKWVLNEEESLPLLKAAWDAGIQTWDTADVYSNVHCLHPSVNDRASRRLLWEKPSRSTIFPAKSLSS